MSDIRAKILAMRKLNNELEREVEFTVPFTYSYTESTDGCKVELNAAGQKYSVEQPNCDIGPIFVMLETAAERIEKYIAIARDLNAYCLKTNVKFSVEVTSTTTRESHPPQCSMFLTAQLGDIVKKLQFPNHNVVGAKLVMLRQLAEAVEERSKEQTPQAEPALQ